MTATKVKTRKKRAQQETSPAKVKPSKQKFTASKLLAEANEIHERITQRDTEAGKLSKSNLQDARRVGELLIEALQKIPHKEKKKYISEHFHGGYVTSTIYRNIHRYWNLVSVCDSINEARSMMHRVKDNYAEEQDGEPEPPTTNAEEVQAVWYQAPPMKVEDVALPITGQKVSGRSMYGAARNSLLKTATNVIKSYSRQVTILLGCDLLPNRLLAECLNDLAARFEIIADRVFHLLTIREYKLGRVGYKMTVRPSRGKDEDDEEVGAFVENLSKDDTLSEADKQRERDTIWHEYNEGVKKLLAVYEGVNDDLRQKLEAMLLAKIDQDVAA